MSQPASNASTLQALSDKYRASLASIDVDTIRPEPEGSWPDPPAEIEIVPEVLVPDEPPVTPVVVVAESDEADPGVTAGLRPRRSPRAK